MHPDKTCIARVERGFDSGNTAAVVSHGLVKEDRVPPRAIDWAVQRKRKFETDPALHTHEGEVE